ncbi:hypothetical protein HPG69_013725 [Diceros bicornis minor]|uniref:Uncharacterized protein n=1 Tax=Diceros bicornis minor TaxID=77932 RepID=A0A7J7EJ33_DICBM|nr:hypothetical protein HPG69_013725 [Diceros bicornis minor]
MSLQSRVSGRLAQLRAAGQLLVAPRSWPGPLAGPPRTRSSAAAPRAQTPAGVGACGAAAVGRRVGVRTWAPLAMAAKVDLSTSTDWKEAKCKCKQEGGARGEGGPTRAFPGWTATHQQPPPPRDLGKLRPHMLWCEPPCSQPRPPCPDQQTTSPQTREQQPRVVGKRAREARPGHLFRDLPLSLGSSSPPLLFLGAAENFQTA